MSDGILGKAKFKCKNCGCIRNLNNEDFTFDSESSSQRNMGEENQYSACIEIPCDECNQDISLNFSVWEYPVGIINDSDESAIGADILESNFDIYHRPPDEDEEDNSRVMGAAAGGAIFGASIGGPIGAIIGGIFGGIIGDSVKKGGNKNG
jgi:hypothetical protein